MILRKPYAFLIKHFKLIHLIISALIIYAAYQLSDTLNFISNYSKTKLYRLEALSHIHSTAIIAIIFSMIVVAIIIWLMKYKKKPHLVYLIYIGAYIFVITISLISFKELNTIYAGNATAKGMRAIIDLLRISSWIQYYLIACMLVRGLGFDIKRFNFANDLEEFKITKEDSEEVEVTFNSGTDKLQRTGRRSLRELSYYYQENKVIILIIFSVIILVFALGIIKNRTITNVVYNEGDISSSGNFDIGVISSYITDLSYDGTKIVNDNEKLVVVKVSAKTNNNYKYKLNNNYLVLEISGTQYTPINKYNDYFTDMGTNYKNQYITPSIKYFIFIYKIDSKLSQKNMKFLYLGSLINNRDLNFNINPINLSRTKNISNIILGNKMNFNKTILNDTSLKITKYELQEKFTYNYCYLNNCNNEAIIDSSGNNILKLTIDSKIDDSIGIEKNWNDIFNNYMKIYYNINNTDKESIFHYTKTPPEINNNIYIEVDKEIENASKIWLEFNIRNQIYKYIIKDS